MNYRSLVFPILAATIAAALTRYYWPRVDTKTVTKTRIEYQNHTVTRIVKQPSGVIVTEIDSTTNQTTEQNRTSISYKTAEWRVGLLATIPTATDSRISAPARYMPQYGMEVQKRLVGPLYAGILYVHPYVGLQIGLEF